MGQVIEKTDVYTNQNIFGYYFTRISLNIKLLETNEGRISVYATVSARTRIPQTEEAPSVNIEAERPASLHIFFNETYLGYIDILTVNRTIAPGDEEEIAYGSKTFNPNYYNINIDNNNITVKYTLSTTTDHYPVYPVNPVIQDKTIGSWQITQLILAKDTNGDILSVADAITLNTGWLLGKYLALPPTGSDAITINCKNTTATKAFELEVLLNGSIISSSIVSTNLDSPVVDIYDIKKSSYSNSNNKAFISLSIERKTTAPSAPTNLSHSSTNNYRYSSSNNITYKWSAVSKATSYEIQVSGCSHNPNGWTYSKGDTSYSDYFTSKHIGESFKFRVRAKNSAGDSEWSSYSSNFTIKGYFILKVGGSTWQNITASSFNPAEWTPAATAGQIFDGWYTKATGGNKYTSTITFNSSTPSITAYAHFVSASSSKITLYGNGGKFNGATTTTANLDSNNRWKVTTLPTRTGYTCPGYGKTAETTTVSYKYNTTYPFTNNQIIYAVWKQDGTITYDLNAPKSVKDGTSLTVSPTSIPSGKKIYNVAYTITTTTPEITGYTFDGWKKGSGSTIYQPGASYTTNGDATLTAQWTGKSYKYKYIQPSPGPSLTLPSAGTYTYNSTFTFPNITSPITVEDGTVWRHTGWNVKNGEEETIYSGATFPFLYSNNNTQLQTQWRKDTGWSVANIWIYVPSTTQNIGNEIEFNNIDLTLEEE